MTIDEWLEKRKKNSRNVRTVMNSFLRGLATFHNNNASKLHTIVKYREQLGPEWCLKVKSSVDDIIEEFQRLSAALEDSEEDVVQAYRAKRAELPARISRAAEQEK